MAITPPDSNTFLARGIAHSSSQNKLMTQSRRDASRLEQPRNQTPSHVTCILGISREVSREKALFIQESPDEPRNNNKNSEEPVPRVERKRYAHKQKERSGIHGMPDPRIGTSRYDLLIVRDLDRRRCVAVLSQHKKDEQESQRNQPISDDRDIGWHRRPAEPVIEHGKHQERDEPEHHQSHNSLLRSFCFSPRSGAQAPLQKFLVVKG